MPASNGRGMILNGIHDKIALITGAAQGIGLAIARKLSDEGAHTIMTDMDKKVFSSFENLKKDYPRNSGFAALMDVTKKEEIIKLVDEAKGRYGSINILVNNAGILLEALFLETTEEIWDRQMAVNAKGVLICSQAVLPQMIARKYGRIVNMASLAGKYAEPGIPAYSASKAAVIRLTQAMAHEMAEHNIRVNCVCPSGVDTAMVARTLAVRTKVLGITAEELTQMVNAQTPLKRIAQPEEIANVVAFLVSDESSYMTGQAINITGGRAWY